MGHHITDSLELPQFPAELSWLPAGAGIRRNLPGGCFLTCEGIKWVEIPLWELDP